ncbi:glycosyltransferase [Breoghania sp.]|uniref:glycosyltransferase n=1 Tax=Breoghania sp. TaxID=2065378 RepID=UPI002AAB7623|nr:glycosyltransferase [Breoghania sp.]
MFSVVIPTFNNEATLVEMLAALVPASAEGVVREVIVVDGGSSDLTETIAEAAGCRWMKAVGQRGARLATGAAAAKRGEWLLFLEPDMVLDPDWFRDVGKFVERVERIGQGDCRAACFRPVNEDIGLRARIAELGGWMRARVLAIAHPRQGLLLSRRFYETLQGHDRASPLADAEIVRRIGRRRMTHLPVRAVRRHVPEAGARRSVLRGWLAMALFFLRVPGAVIGRVVGPSAH